jgi:NAD+ synthase
LEGKEVSAETAERLMSLYEKTQHKRLPVTTIYEE